MIIRALCQVCLIVLMCLALIRCGGSGSNAASTPTSAAGTPPGPPTPGQAQGLYTGTTSMGFALNAIVLPDDQFYALYGNTSGSIFYICGMETGQGSSASGRYTATETDFYYCNGSLLTYGGNVNAVYTPGSFNGLLTEGGMSESFNATSLSETLFNYDTPASVSAIAGSWTAELPDKHYAQVTIDSTGNITGVDVFGCSFSGTITPDASKKNFFDVSLTFGNSPCTLPGQQASGIAISYLLSDGTTRQLMAGVSSGGSFAFLFAAQQ